MNSVLLIFKIKLGLHPFALLRMHSHRETSVENPIEYTTTLNSAIIHLSSV